ncbi:MAG: DEAD/DEAH box helicase family protein, partial [Thermoguttaceae bacterium]|nr:DEAD/DEAH box helicase family protein [Thermoguttaceae bacterium]
MTAKFEPRWYQREAVEAVYRCLRADAASVPCVVLPTGAGKTPVLATLCRDVARCGG